MQLSEITRKLFTVDIQDQSSQKEISIFPAQHSVQHICRCDNPNYMTLNTLIFLMCCFFSSVSGDPSPLCLPISLNSCLVRRGGSTWAGFACSGWSVAFLLQQWLGASSPITVIVLCFWLLATSPSCNTTLLQNPAQMTLVSPYTAQDEQNWK